VFLGTLTGFAEVGLLFALSQLGDRMVFLGRHAAWMRPAVEGAVFVIAGLLLLAFLGARRWSARLDVTLGIYLLLATVAGLQLVPQLHPLARIVLAAGASLQLARWLSPHLVGRDRLVKRAGAAAISCVVVLAATWTLGPRTLERRSLAALGPAPAGAPNVLLVILDTVRASSLSVYGHERPTTPFLETLAREALRFERAISPAPWTLPSHASMFTGRSTHELSADWRRTLDAEYPTLAEYLRENGYATAGFVANLGYCGWESGLGRGFIRYEDNPVSFRQAITESSLLNTVVDHRWFKTLVGRDENFMRKSGDEVNRAFLDWLRGQPENRPFMAFLNYYDAHDPYQPPEPFRSRLATGASRGRMSPLHRWNDDPFNPLPADSIIRQEREAYEGAIAYLDQKLAELVGELEHLGRLDETIVIITSDHGEEFGEHGVYDHGNSLYIEGIHVPLLIRYPPRVDGGRVRVEPVSLTRLPATVLDLVGFESAGPFPGGSLMESESEAVRSDVSYSPGLPDWFPVSRGDMRSAIRGPLHYILNGDGTEELFELSTDPAERWDLSERTEYGAALLRLREDVR
jgi:arylsulfatase A-like enzyme